MEAVLDTIWEQLAAGFIFLGDTFFGLVSHLHFLDPAILIALLAFATVAVTKVLSRLIVTRRYLELEKKFNYWVELRNQALECEDHEKGRRMARNIDQAELNKAYYDYFFEGLLLGIARRVIPIFFVFGFINEYYRPEKMIEMFGREYMLRFGATGDNPVLIGSVFWFFICLLLIFIFWAIAASFLRKNKKIEKKVLSPAPLSPEKRSCPSS